MERLEGKTEAKRSGRMDMKSVSAVVEKLRSHASKRNVEGMARYGIIAKKAFGVSVPTIRALAKRIGRNHDLALQLWKTQILEARTIATLIDDPDKVTRKQMELWVKDFDNWAVCDACCGNLFDKTTFWFEKAMKWSRRKEEFVKRAGFVLMAESAVHNKIADNKVYRKFLPVIQREANDERSMVKKGINWALRQIGKRNRALHAAAVKTGRAIQRMDSPAARWIASDALRELLSPSVLKRIARKNLEAVRR